MSWLLTVEFLTTDCSQLLCRSHITLLLHLRNILKNSLFKVKVGGVFFLLVLAALILLTYFIFVTKQKCQKHLLDSEPGIAPSGVPETQKERKKKTSKFDYSIFFVSEEIINNRINPWISETKWCSWTETSVAFDILAASVLPLLDSEMPNLISGEGLFDLQTVTPLLHGSHWLMVAGNSAVMPGQLAAWHSLYLAHPAEQFMSTHKQDLVIYDCPPQRFFRFSAARVWIGRDKANGCRGGACDGAQSMCYLCLFSVTALASGRQTLAAVWLDT